MAWAMTPWWRRATSCWAWPPRARFWPRCAPMGLEDAPQLQIDVDRDKASALGVNFDAINTTLSTALFGLYQRLSQSGPLAAGRGAG